MADLFETEAALDGNNDWTAGIYQLEQADLVLGGAEGIDNLQARQLLARINLLKTMALMLGTGKQPLNALLSALAALVTSADKTIYFTGENAPALTAMTALARTFLAAATQADARAAIGAATQSDIDAAIAALVNSSPAALDTLSEFAAALGNDANFAATMINALAFKAALESPAFSGNPTAPTPPQFDNSTKLATTAFMQRALGNVRGFASFNTNTNLTAADSGKDIYCSGTCTITLPDEETVPPGGRYHVFNSGSGVVTLDCFSGDSVYIGGGAITQYVLLPGDDVVVDSAGGGIWYAMGGSAQLKYAGVFGASLTGGSGYQLLPSGRIEQWGSINTSASGDVELTFPITFPTALRSIVASYGGSGATTTGSAISFGTSTASNIQVGGYSAGWTTRAAFPIFWFAVGH